MRSLAAGMEATVMVHVAMADTFGFHGNGELSDWQEPTAGFTALDGHFEFRIYVHIYLPIYKKIQLQKQPAGTNTISAHD